MGGGGGYVIQRTPNTFKLNHVYFRLYISVVAKKYPFLFIYLLPEVTCER